MLGDSKLVIDWANRRVIAHNIGLDPLLQYIQHVANTFDWISYCHIFHKLSEEVDALSKEALELPPRLVILYEFNDRVEVDSREMRL